MRYLWLLALLGACKTERMNTPDAPGPPVDPWWQPKVGHAKNWDIQLGPPYDVGTERVMYDLDLWALVPAPTVINEDDGSMVNVPAGALAGKIDVLHATATPTVVICHINTGVLRLDEPDAMRFKGYETNPPDMPTNPKAGSVIGWSTGAPMERYLDIREASVAMWTSVMWKRFDLAKQIGCDGIEGTGIERSINTGFNEVATDLFAFYAEVATQTHMRKLSAGMKNGSVVPDTIDMGAGKFDWMMFERCGEAPNCDLAKPFIDLEKAVFAIDYDHTFEGDPQVSDGVCARQGQDDVADGIYKDVALTKNVRVQCQP